MDWTHHKHWYQDDLCSAEDGCLGGKTFSVGLGSFFGGGFGGCFVGRSGGGSLGFGFGSVDCF